MNKSGLEIIDGKIEVCGQTFPLQKMNPNEHESLNFLPTTDSSYKVTVHFADGHSITEDVGYVTNGFNVTSVVEITENHISLEMSSFE